MDGGVVGGWGRAPLRGGGGGGGRGGGRGGRAGGGDGPRAGRDGLGGEVNPKKWNFKNWEIENSTNYRFSGLRGSRPALGARCQRPGRPRPAGGPGALRLGGHLPHCLHIPSGGFQHWSQGHARQCAFPACSGGRGFFSPDGAVREACRRASRPSIAFVGKPSHASLPKHRKRWVRTKGWCLDKGPSTENPRHRGQPHPLTHPKPPETEKPLATHHACNVMMECSQCESLSALQGGFILQLKISSAQPMGKKKRALSHPISWAVY